MVLSHLSKVRHIKRSGRMLESYFILLGFQFVIIKHVINSQSLTEKMHGIIIIWITD